MRLLHLVVACSLVASTYTASVATVPPTENVDWPNVGNDKGGMRYSMLAQIDRGNVKNLKVAWVYHTRDADPDANTTIECTPVVVDGVMYVTTARSKIVALDAATGRERWKYDPYADEKPRILASGGVNRGVGYWSDGIRDGQRRVLLATSDGRLISLDAKSGQPDTAFGRDGSVDMREGLGTAGKDYSHDSYGATAAVAIWRNNIIVGYSVTEGPGPGAPGDIRAFDVHSGRQVWRFHTVPRPGEYAHETWPADSWKDRSGVNAWDGFTVDAKRGIVYAGVGSASFDFYGGDRKGPNLFANCTLALDARTGKRI